jgi:hypothetical protein
MADAGAAARPRARSAGPGPGPQRTQVIALGKSQTNARLKQGAPERNLRLDDWVRKGDPVRSSTRLRSNSMGTPKTEQRLRFKRAQERALEENGLKRPAHGGRPPGSRNKRKTAAADAALSAKRSRAPMPRAADGAPQVAAPAAEEAAGSAAPAPAPAAPVSVPAAGGPSRKELLAQRKDALEKMVPLKAKRPALVKRLLQLLYIISFMYLYPRDISVTQALIESHMCSASDRGDGNSLWRVRKRVKAFIDHEIVHFGKRGGKRDNVSYLAFPDIRESVISWYGSLSLRARYSRIARAQGSRMHRGAHCFHAPHQEARR